MKKIRLFLLAILAVSVHFVALSQESTTTVKYSNITEGGFFGSPKHFSCELTTVNGIIINNQHQIGIGVGFGGPIDDGLSCPIFANYRYRFQTSTKYLKPHINVAVGALLLEENVGLYSTLGAGFKVGAFSLTSGLFFQMYESTETVWVYDGGHSYPTTATTPQHLFGVMIRIGVNF